jgi:hypothetical protein
VNVKKIFGLAAIAGLLFVATPNQQANAMSLSGPGMAASVQSSTSEALTTQVQYRPHHRGYRPHHGMRRHHGWHRPHHIRRHHGWHRPHHSHHRRNWR